MAGEYPHVVTDTNVKISLPNTLNVFFLPVPIFRRSHFYAQIWDT